MKPTLTHSLIAAPGSRPRSWLLVLHGIFGAGRNWGTVARRLVTARPQWGVALVDLRMHGESQGFPPPYTLETSAGDLVDIRRSLADRLRAVLGHSFGGKVALAYLRSRPPDLQQVWVIDADPSAMEPTGTSWEMLHAVTALPSRFQSRAEATAGLEHLGFDRRVAQWMATNLEPVDGWYQWRLDFHALEGLLRGFFGTDLWKVIEDPPANVALHFVKAIDSRAMSESTLARLEAIGRATERVFVHHLRGGHWLNVDNPDAVVALLNSTLPDGTHGLQ